MEKKNYIRRIMDVVNLPTEPHPGVPVVEILGNCRVLIERHCGVIAYDENMIEIKTKYGQLNINGCQLQLTQMTKAQLIVSGKIFGVTLCEKGRHSS